MDIERKIEKVYGFPGLLSEKKAHFCPGCSHGILTRVISEVIAEMGFTNNAIGVYGTGCASLMYEYLEIKAVAAPPGSAAGVAAGIKVAMPDHLVFVYQGDGDLASGISTLFGAAMRGQRITVICENNFTLGMSGGSMSGTTPLGYTTTTSPEGREKEVYGYPLRFVEILKGMKGITYIARGSTHSPGAVKKVKNMLRKAFTAQMYESGMSFVEVLGMCPTNLNIPPVETAQKVKETLEEFPTGEFK